MVSANHEVSDAIHQPDLLGHAKFEAMRDELSEPFIKLDLDPNSYPIRRSVARSRTTEFPSLPVVAGRVRANTLPSIVSMVTVDGIPASTLLPAPQVGSMFPSLREENQDPLCVESIPFEIEITKRISPSATQVLDPQLFFSETFSRSQRPCHLQQAHARHPTPRTRNSKRAHVRRKSATMPCLLYLDHYGYHPTFKSGKVSEAR
jgi:hypothetical protein